MTNDESKRQDIRPRIDTNYQTRSKSTLSPDYHIAANELRGMPNASNAMEAKSKQLGLVLLLPLTRLHTSARQVSLATTIAAYRSQT